MSTATEPVAGPKQHMSKNDWPLNPLLTFDASRFRVLLSCEITRVNTETTKFLRPVCPNWHSLLPQLQSAGCIRHPLLPAEDRQKEP
jgi:hypothetical protein